MARKSQSEYQATYRQRKLVNDAAKGLGWKKLDVLGAFKTKSGEVIVIDHDMNRYELTGDSNA